MQPTGEAALRMLKVTGFVQRNPNDGAPPTQRTEAYLGYDDKNFFAVFVCFDREPQKVRARLARREDIFDDDTVELMLDTFQDQRRAYAFQTNPLGIQWDAIWTEAPREDVNFDPSFDTLWYSEGRVTPQGFVVWMAIPFKSLRFSPEAQHSWGIILNRTVVRDNEDAFWPEISRRVEGRLNQAASGRGLEGISPGRNIQLIPYGALRSFRAPDSTSKSAEFRGGLDSKFIFHDSLVLDTTLNPDFSQVESDEPQITVNQRFEVFFPEKRPFFQENADYFRTPIDLFFSRRIADPQFGTRLTGKVGHYSLGVLAADDRAPGKIVPAFDPLAGDRAVFTIARVNRDILGQSSVGVIYTDREFPGAGAYNRVGGVDSRLKFNPNWTGTLQAVTSSTRNNDGSYQAGPAYLADAEYSGRNLNYKFEYNDVSPGFATEAGFVNRVDVREVRQSVNYRWYPKGQALLSWGPSFFTDWVWDHQRTRLDALYSPALVFRFKGSSSLIFFPYTDLHEQLRPVDFPTLPGNRDYHEHNSSVSAATSYLRWLTVQAAYQWGDGVNFVSPSGQQPFLASADTASLTLGLRPITPLKIDNTYLFDRLRARASGAAVFNNHILRSKWNWQFTRELSLRLILQYTSTLANPRLTFLETSKNFNADLLFTYLLHPGTALYVGYNSNLRNLDPVRGYANDGRQIFVKVSYLFRF